MAKGRATSSEPAADINKIDARARLDGATSGGGVSTLSALAQATVPAWVQTAVMVSLIFGGCCSNDEGDAEVEEEEAKPTAAPAQQVFALEAIIKTEPQSGHLLTFAQFLFVALEGLHHHFDRHSPTLLKKNAVPLYRWAVQILLYFSVSVLNNYAFGFRISVPVHIILRSGGSMTTLVVGWVFGKRYTRMQLLSVLILTLGIALCAYSDNPPPPPSTSPTPTSTSTYITGLLILLLAQVLSAFMGLYIERTYHTFGHHPREGLFYSHFLSLPLFLPLLPSIRAQWNRLGGLRWYLLANAATHYVCSRGVNLLAARSSALTVTVVLNVRKLVSVVVSVWVFGNVLGWGVGLGAAVVFAGGGLYALEGQRVKREKAAAAGGKKVD
ncbi:UAA transporter [Morchella conica CCBAS932]|uniref:UAA transporter n=1 Tax=Morchella conica CCBAS932 TaxID=1392247 RepID=A0A3N4L4E9_9PEZI|nr:UAA transporter [Morchella conica CCBAS932]